jgi:sulfatase maturation enzyme AslB (radical SAM superfamily)
MYIYQIEVSNVCSLRCAYCPHPTQKRKKSFMTFDTFKKCVEFFKLCDNKGYLFLHNFGEVLLHPQILDFIQYATDQGVKCSFFTNGVTPKKIPFTREFWRQLADRGLEAVDFSAHAISSAEFMRITDGIVKVNHVFDPSIDHLHTWAGQIGAPDDPAKRPCLFQRKNAFVVLWDGRISTCCFDVEGLRSALWVDDLLRTKTYQFEPIVLCKGCASMRDDEEM